MNAAEVRDALFSRWPATQYVVVEEAPEDPMRAGRKIDLLVISCWKSRGYEVEAAHRGGVVTPLDGAMTDP